MNTLFMILNGKDYLFDTLAYNASKDKRANGGAKHIGGVRYGSRHSSCLQKEF